MRIRHLLGGVSFKIIAFGTLPVIVLGNDILKTQGFTTCLDKSTITVTNLDIQYDRSAGTIIFDVGGASSRAQYVKASLTVTAYGKQVYRKDFNPCEDGTKVTQLCPVPSGSFAAKGSQTIPSNFIKEIPAIAFSIPDLEGEAKLELKAADGGESLACIESNVNNGRSVDLPAVSYVAVGIAGAALLLTGLAALGGAGGPGGSSPSPNFGDVVGWFQSMAMNGMLSVKYPPVYRNFAKNFAFSGGLVPWNAMQTSIDKFRNATGGNLTENSVQYLQHAVLVFTDKSNTKPNSIAKRSLILIEDFSLTSRDLSTSTNGTNPTGSTNKVTHVVHGIQGYVEQLTIPRANTFMTVLLIFAIVISAITVGILLLKVILETWALFGSFPQKLTNFRKRYWGLLARTITNLILLLYGVWTIYCVYQFTNGDSWAAKVLAGVTLALFSAILGFFTIRIWQLAKRFKKSEGDASALFEDKETWRKYSLFYDSYKRGYWWLFMPTIVYMFARGCIIAAGDGHGLTQTAGQLIVETLMLALLLWSRPYATKAGNWINFFIQTIRVLSVICILVFVEQLGISQSTKTITGVVLIAVQSVLTATLAILIAVNSIIFCCKENPHRKRRKEAEKIKRDFDNLTPLDARNSLLMDPITKWDRKDPQAKGYPLSASVSRMSVDSGQHHGDQASSRRWAGRDSSDNLVASAASMGLRRQRSISPDEEENPSRAARQPTIPSFVGYQENRYSRLHTDPVAH